MEQVYVTGHRNPDTDSIVSAMAYAALRNALGDREYVAARLGHLNDESKRILDRFGFEPPLYIQNMKTQVRDLEYDTPPALAAGLTVNRGWSTLKNDSTIAAIPVTSADGELYGMLTSGDVASYDMETVADPMIREVPLFNLLSALEGKVLNDAGSDMDTISGQVVLALPKGAGQHLFDGENYIAICGDQLGPGSQYPLSDPLRGGAQPGAPGAPHPDLHHLHAVGRLSGSPADLPGHSHRTDLPDQGSGHLPPGGLSG